MTGKFLLCVFRWAGFEPAMSIFSRAVSFFLSWHWSIDFIRDLLLIWTFALACKTTIFMVQETASFIIPNARGENVKGTSDA